MDDVHEGEMNYGCIYFIVSFYPELSGSSWRFNLNLLVYFQRSAPNYYFLVENESL